jgi:hypothetical protein
MLMEDENFQRQITEDTCEDHGAFCCPVCFDLKPVEKETHWGEEYWDGPRIETDENWELVRPVKPLRDPTRGEEWALWYCDMLDELAWFFASIGLKSWAMRIDRKIDRIALPITKRRMV